MVVFGPGSYELVSVSYPFGLSLSKPGRLLSVLKEPVEALACWFGRRAGVEDGGRVVAPAGDSLSFVSPKESKQRKGAPQSATPALRYGANLRRGGCGVRRRTHCALSALRSDNCGESVHEAWALRRPCHPTTAPPQAQPAGCWAAEHPNSHTGHCCARPHIAGASASRCAGAAERSAAKQWPVWMSDSRVPFTMRRGAQGVGRHGRRSARASCSDSLRLSERSAQRVESSAARPTSEHRRLPAAKRRDAACRVALSLVNFFRRREKKLLACRATPGLRPQPMRVATIAKPGLTRLRPNRPESI